MVLCFVFVHRHQLDRCLFAFADIIMFFVQPRLYRLYLCARRIFHPVIAPAMADGITSITQEMLRDRVVKARILSCFLFVQFG